MAASVSLIPYADASATQQYQALLSARQVLDAAYPDLTRAQWAAALAHVNPLLDPAAPDHAVLPHAGLAALVYHLASGSVPDHPASEPASEPAATPAAPAAGAAPAPASRKQTYAMPDDVCEQLADFSYWSRWPICKLVAEGARRLMASRPEFQRPRPT